MSITHAKTRRIVGMFLTGQTIDEIAVAGLRYGWSYADCEQVATTNGWRIGPDGRTHRPLTPPRGAKRPVQQPPAKKAKGAPPRVREDQPLTVPEIAADLRVSRMSVYRLIHDGTLPAIRVGRSFRVPVAAYDRYLAGIATGDVA